MQTLVSGHREHNRKSSPIIEVHLVSKGDSRPNQEGCFFESIIEGDTASDEGEISAKLPEGEARAFHGQL